ncbi:MAG TPA: glycosyltransferase [archaeon]|nr:glycosyltransferase [archaeon]
MDEQKLSLPSALLFSSKEEIKMEIEYSFIIPTRNEEGYLKGCMDSVKSQTVKNWEMIVVDGLSTDATARLAKEAGAKVVYEKRKGPSVARNAGARNAHGRILIFADADVRFPHDFLERLCMIKGGCIFDLKFWDASVFANATFAAWNVTIRLLMKAGVTITNGSCLAFDSVTFNKIGGFRDDLLTNEDHDIAIRSAKAGGFFFCPLKVLTSARRIKKSGVIAYLRMHFRNTKNYMIHNSSNPEYWDYGK